MTEAELQDGIATAAQYAGWKVMHVRPARTNDGGWRTAVGYDGKGWPDLFLAHPDRGVMAIECKSARGRLTLEQSDWLDTLAVAGVDGLQAEAIPWHLQALDIRLDLGSPDASIDLDNLRRIRQSLGEDTFTTQVGQHLDHESAANLLGMLDWGDEGDPNND